MSARSQVVIDFFADLSCPWCYVGWAALKQAGAARREQISVALNWRAFLLAPEMPREGVDRAQHLAKHYTPERIAAAHAALEGAAAAAEAPLNLSASTRFPNTIDAHRLVHWAAQQAHAGPVIDAVFAAYFVDGRDIGARATLVEIAESCGLDPHEIGDWLSSDRDRDTILAFHNAAIQLGINAVPVAVVNRKRAVMGAQGADAYIAALDAA